MIIIAVIVIVASGSHRRLVAGGARAAVCVAAAITATVAVVVAVVVDAVEIETGLVCVFASARLPPARLGDAVVDAVAGAGMVRTVRCRVRGRIGR